MRILGAIVVSAAAFGLSGCVDLGARAWVGFTQTDLTGNVALDSSAGGTNLGARENDLEQDFGVTDSSPSVWVKAQVEPPALGRITLSGFTYGEEATGTLARDFGDLAAGTSVTSEFDFDNVKASWTFDLLDVGALYVAPGIAVDVFAIDTRISSNSSVAAEDVDSLAFVPMVYAQAGADLVVASLDVEAGWMSIDLEDADGDYLDLEAMLRVNPLPMVELVGGYRFIQIDGAGRADGQRFTADIELSGWYVGGGVSF